MHSIQFDRRDGCFLSTTKTPLPCPDKDLPRNIQRAIQIVAVGYHPEILPGNPNLRVMLCELLRCLPFKNPRAAIVVRKSLLATRLGKGTASVHRYLHQLEAMGVIRRSEQVVTRREGAQIGEIYLTDAALHAMGFYSHTNLPSHAFEPVIDAKRESRMSDASDVVSYSSSKKQSSRENLQKENHEEEIDQSLDQVETSRIPQELHWLTTLPSGGLTQAQIFQLMGMCRKAYGCNLSLLVLPARSYIENKARKALPYIQSLMGKGVEWFRRHVKQQEEQSAVLHPPSQQQSLHGLLAKAKTLEGVQFIGSSGYVLTVANGVVRRFDPRKPFEVVGDVLLTEGFFAAIDEGRLVRYQAAH